MRRAIVAVVLAAAAVLEANAAAPDERLAVCMACHGEKGQSETPQIPSLGAQTAAYSLIQLYLFREKLRPSEVMINAAQGLTDDDLRLLSDLIAKLPPSVPPQEPPDEARIARGRALATQNRCGFCHNPDFAGRDNVPRLAAQREDYLVRALREYKSNARPGYDASMAEVVAVLDDAAMTDLAYFLAHVR